MSAGVSSVPALTDADFEETVAGAGQPLLVDFWAPWCAPCRMLASAIDELADEFAGRALVRQLNVDENAETQGRLGVISLPTVLLFRGGQPVERVVGYRDGIKQQLGDRLRELL